MDICSTCNFVTQMKISRSTNEINILLRLSLYVNEIRVWLQVTKPWGTGGPWATTVLLQLKRLKVWRFGKKMSWIKTRPCWDRERGRIRRVQFGWETRRPRDRKRHRYSWAVYFMFCICSFSWFCDLTEYKAQWSKLQDAALKTDKGRQRKPLSISGLRSQQIGSPEDGTQWDLSVKWEFPPLYQVDAICIFLGGIIPCASAQKPIASRDWKMPPLQAVYSVCIHNVASCLFL